MILPRLSTYLRRSLSLSVCLSVLLGSAPVQADYTADTCARDKPQNRVRADLVFDLETGKILSESHADEVFHPASLSKLMALAVVFDALRAGDLRYTDIVTLVRVPGQIDGRSSGVTRMTVADAIDGVATASLNNALDGIAARLGSKTFIGRMNRKAADWGLKHTVFVNATGWPTPASMQFQRTTLYDLARLIRHLWQDYPQEMKRFAGKPEVAIAGIKMPLKSTNNLLETATSSHAVPYPGVVAGKTGYTCYSGWHLMTLYEDRLIGGRRMVALTVGHATGQARDAHMRDLIDTAEPKLRQFARAEALRIEKEIEATKRRLAAGQAVPVAPQ